jgi:NDP-sugar pyrophosphorylase family protein
MQIAILAGGLATRLQPLTEKVSKSMIMIEGKPFLQYQLEFLKKGGISNIVLCVGYLSEQIETYFGDGKRFGVDIKYSRESERLLGTAGTLKNAETLLEEEFFVMYGDSYLFLNFKEVGIHFQKFNKSALMVVYKNYDKYDKSNVVVEEGMVTKYDKKHKTKDMVYIDYGVSILRKKVLDMVPSNQVYSLEELFPALIKQNEMLASETKERFFEIGSHRGLEEFKKYVVLYLHRKEEEIVK